MITFSKIGIFGRLGNQMFQYAAAKSAAINTGSQLAIPWENNEIIKHFKVDCGYYSLQHNTLNLHRFSKYIELVFEYDDRFNSIADNTDLQGYFQSEKYFVKHEQAIRKDFTFVKEISKPAGNFIASLKHPEQQLVSIHVRKGDYLQLQNYHDNCSLEYYAKAMATFNDCWFVVFLDDMDWCKLHLKGDNIGYSELKTAAEDLCAMSLCHHHIIANSSFSWWGAWLNAYPEKKVVSPGTWFGTDNSHKNTKDLSGVCQIAPGNQSNHI